MSEQIKNLFKHQIPFHSLVQGIVRCGDNYIQDRSIHHPN